MQLFLFLNDLAGRWPLLDGVARFFYVGALPTLGTLLLAQLLILPRSGNGLSRSKTALALVLALALGALLTWGFDLVANWLHLGNLSPRPWMTRRVNWLVVEPQDNSFPCIEMVFAAAVAAASWKLNFRWGIASTVVVVLLGLTRMFCGNNYLADVLVGGALGASSFLVCWQLCRRYLAWGQRAREFSLSASPLMVTLVGCYFFALLSPRFQGKLGIGKPAAAAPPMVMSSHSTASSVTQGEGEGMVPEEGSAEELALAKRSSLFLPEVEAFMRGKLTPIARPFRLLDVEAAPVKAGSTSYRCAAIRFEVPAEKPNMRRVVADRAARLVRTAFAFDSNMENIDIIAVARDEGRNLDNSHLTFVGEEVPVFTASIQRKNLVAPETWGNAPGIDGLSWLRARSLLYINARALPDSPNSLPIPLPPVGRPPTVKGTPSPGGTPTTTGTPIPSGTPTATGTPNATSTPTLTPSARPQKTPTVTPKATPTSRPTPAATKPVGALPTATSRATPKPQRTVQASKTPRPANTPGRATPTPKAPPTATPLADKRTPRPTPARTTTGGTPRP